MRRRSDDPKAWFTADVIIDLYALVEVEVVGADMLYDSSIKLRVARGGLVAPDVHKQCMRISRSPSLNYAWIRLKHCHEREVHVVSEDLAEPM